MNTKDLIKELNAYFVNEIYEGNFDLVSINKHVAEILIDDNLFYLWHSGGSQFFESHSNANNTMKLTFGFKQRMSISQRFADIWKVVSLEDDKRKLQELAVKIADSENKL